RARGFDIAGLAGAQGLVEGRSTRQHLVASRGNHLGVDVAWGAVNRQAGSPDIAHLDSLATGATQTCLLFVFHNPDLLLLILIFTSKRLSSISYSIILHVHIR